MINSSMEARRVAGDCPILVVDDDERYRRAVARILTLEGYKVIEAARASAYDLICQELGCLRR
jgi:DNA-binding NtrC family response regulator